MFSRLSTLVLPLTIATLLSLSCTKKVSGGGTQSVPPVAYCPFIAAPVTFGSPVTIDGTATYQYRQNGNGVVASRPIRYAEVMVKNSSGTIIQCAETTSTGQFQFTLPSGTGDYTVYINSRANNSYVKSYVMSDPTNNTHYSIASTVSSSASSTMTTMTASATGTLEGGAFNILDQIVNANEFLKNQVSVANCATYGSNCTPFSVAPLSYAYWAKGFNPNVYLGGASTNGVSFYLRGTNELYILGGIEGDVDESDCDHFDNSIIVHEYGHFVENEYSASDSQGGAHGPDDTLDPRLGWSEAWANFFQAAVTGDPVYRDTSGNVSCGVGGCTFAFHDENLETPEVYDNGTVDTDEGNFREFAMTRALWDVIDPHPVSANGGNTDESVTAPFAELWSVFSSSTGGFKSSSARFRNIGGYLKLQSSLAGSTNLSSVLTNELIRADELDYASTLKTTGCAARSIQAEAQTDGSFDLSNLFYDNDFYAYQHSGGSVTFRMTYTPGATPVNLNLIIWKDGYQYGNTADMAGSSRRARPDGNEEVVTATLPAGWYMINVMVDPTLTRGSPSTYRLYINGTENCANN